MSTQDNGGPAFPSGLQADDVEMTGGRYEGTYVNRYVAMDGGMTLRDYFAAMAMQGLVASNDDGAGDRIEDIPSYAYAIADAMLKARQE